MNLNKRIELNYLSDWLLRPSHKPLVISGARQVGKSTLAKQFVGQHLLYTGSVYQAPELYYWQREAKAQRQN